MGAALVALFALALVPGVAPAATICVQVSSAACDSSAPSVQTALDGAAGSPAADRVVIGPGRFEGPFHYSAPDGSGRIEVVGQGPATVLTAPGGTVGEAVLSVPGDPQGEGSLVSNLTVRIPSNMSSNGDWGIYADAVSNARVASDAGESAEQDRVGIVVPVAGGSVRNSVVELVDGSADDIGIQAQGQSGAAPTTISDSRVIAPTGVRASASATTLVRDRVTSGDASGGAGVFACNAPVVVEDTLVRIAGPATGLLAEGSSQCSPEQGSILARQVTIVGGFESGSVGAAAYAASSGQDPRIDVVLSIVRDVQTALRATGISPGSSASITAGASDFEAARVVTSAVGGTASFGQPEPNIDADPLFTSDLLGDFSLRPGSPAIDSFYSPALAAGESATDLNGDPRALDGNGDGVAARDMGAFEAPAVPPKPDTTPPDTRIAHAMHGKKLTAGRRGYLLRVSFSSTEPGSRFECRLDAAKFAACSSPFQKRVSAGMHRFEVRAVDAAGNVDPTPARETLRIARPRPKHHGHRHHRH